MQEAIETAYENYLSPLTEKVHTYNQETETWEENKSIDTERVFLKSEEELANDRYGIMKICKFANLDDFFDFFENYHCEILKSSYIRPNAIQMLEEIMNHFVENPPSETQNVQTPTKYYFLLQNNRVEQMVWALKNVSEYLPFLSTVVCDSYDTLDYSEFDYIITEELFFQQQFFKDKLLGTNLEDFFEQESV